MSSTFCMSAQIEEQSDVLYKRWARTDWRAVRITMHQVGQHRQEDSQMSSIPGTDWRRVGYPQYQVQVSIFRSKESRMELLI
jgi:hypothetical protein